MKAFFLLFRYHFFFLSSLYFTSMNKININDAANPTNWLNHNWMLNFRRNIQKKNPAYYLKQKCITITKRFLFLFFCFFLQSCDFYQLYKICCVNLTFFWSNLLFAYHFLNSLCLSIKNTNQKQKKNSEFIDILYETIYIVFRYRTSPSSIDSIYPYLLCMYYAVMLCFSESFQSAKPFCWSSHTPSRFLTAQRTHNIFVDGPQIHLSPSAFTYV